MKMAAAALATLVAFFSAAPYLARTAPILAARSARTHDCCCAACPGPGLCPCDPGASRTNSCVKSPDELPAPVETPAPSPLKLACELPHRPFEDARLERRSESERIPHIRFEADRLEKVPISIA
jgi:hypothetical protein